MGLVVQKFGGTSVATAERIMAAARRAIRAKQAGQRVVVVVSARGDTTDELITLAREITETPPAREMDMLLATGEQISIALLAMAIHVLGESAVSFTGAQVGIVTDSTHGKARIKTITTERLRTALDAGTIVIVAGFQGTDADSNITTLGRGGSDTTAVALAAVLKHDPALAGPGHSVACEIYTDVDGVYTTDPRLVPEARKIESISYDEMLELASAGAGVMHSRSIEFARKFDVPVIVRSSFSDAEGTWIVPEVAWMRDVVVSGAAVVKDEARVHLDGVPDQPGVSHRIFAAVADQNIAVDMIAQSAGRGGVASIGFTVTRGELPVTLEALRPLAAELGASLTHDDNVSKVSVVGTGMRTHTGVAERMFAALSHEGINLRMITTADIKISVLIDRDDAQRALRAVHQAFALDQPRPGAGMPAARSGPAEGRADEATSRAVLDRLMTAMEDIVVSDVQLDDSYGRITITDLPNRAGTCTQVFQAVAAGGINVDMIVQNLTADGRAELSFSVPRADLERALAQTRGVLESIDSTARSTAEADIAVLYVLGVGMRTHTGVARAMFGALAARGINISLINTSEVCVSVVVAGSRGQEALACLRETFLIR